MDDSSQTSDKEIIEFMNQKMSDEEKKIIKQLINKLINKEDNFKDHISTLIIILSLKSIDDIEISIDIYNGVLLDLNNSLLSNINKLTENEIISYLKDLFNLMFIKYEENERINDPKILLKLFVIIKNIFFSQKLKSNFNYIYDKLKIIEKYLGEQKHFIENSKKIVELINILLSGTINDSKNYIIYFIMRITDEIYNNNSNYINLKKKICDYEYIGIINKIYKILFFFLKKEIKVPEKYLINYGINSYYLLRLSPLFDDMTSKIFTKENPIIIFNTKENQYNEINCLKITIFKFLEILIHKINLEEDFIQYDKIKNEIIPDKNELISTIRKVINISKDSITDVLNDELKLKYFRKYNNKDDDKKNEDHLNLLLLSIFSFFGKCLITKPFESYYTLSEKKYIIINVIFPMMISYEDEFNFLENKPKEYNEFIKNITKTFSGENIRTCVCSIVKNLCQTDDDIKNFIIYFILEMIDSIINKEKKENNLGEYNEYSRYFNNSYINKFNDYMRLDLSLLNILIIVGFYNDYYFYNYLRELLVNNQIKINAIENNIIKIKLCRIYSFILPCIFEKSENIPESIINNYQERSINFLINNIIQKEISNNYQSALSSIACKSIIFLLNDKTYDDIDDKYYNNHLIDYIIKNLEKYFFLFIKLIEKTDVIEFYKLIKLILNEIKINEGNLVFESLVSLTKKFKKEYIKNGNDKNILFIKEYFMILKSFLTGVNKIKENEKTEIIRVNEIFEQFENINFSNCEYYEEFLLAVNEYISNIKEINNLSIKIIKNLGQIIDKEQKLNLTVFNFISKIMSFFKMNISNNNQRNQSKNPLFDEVIILIKKCFSLDSGKNHDLKIYPLLLIIQIISTNYENLIGEDLKYMINISLNIINNLDNYYSSYNINKKKKLLEVSLASLYLGFIFFPVLTFNLTKDNLNSLEKSLINLSVCNYCNSYLMKIIILGLSGFFTNKNCLEYLDNNLNEKEKFLKIFINIILKHRIDSINALKLKAADEMHMDFIDDNINEDLNEEEYDTCFNDLIDPVLINNEEIYNSDEFIYSSQIIKYIKNYDKSFYNKSICQGIKMDQVINKNILSNKIITIKYKEKEYKIPRRIIHIKKK